MPRLGIDPVHAQMLDHLSVRSGERKKHGVSLAVLSVGSGYPRSLTAGFSTG
jgi:hypothetical protein